MMKGWPRLKDREGILGCWLGREFLEVVIKRKFNFRDMCLFFLSMGHFTVMDGSEAEGDLVLIQTFFALLWKLFLKNTS